MKKIMMMLAAVLCCSAMMYLLSSCNKPVNPPTSEKKLEAEMTYKFRANSKIRSHFDVTVEYYDADGQVKSEQVTDEGSFEKKVRTKLPCKLGMRVLLQVKEGQDVNTIRAFAGAYTYKVTGYVVDDDDYVVSDVAEVEDEVSFTIAEGKVAEWYEDHKDGLVSILYAFKEDKTFSRIEW